MLWFIFLCHNLGSMWPLSLQWERRVSLWLKSWWCFRGQGLLPVRTHNLAINEGATCFLLFDFVSTWVLDGCHSVPADRPWMQHACTKMPMLKLSVLPSVWQWWNQGWPADQMSAARQRRQHDWGLLAFANRTNLFHQTGHDESWEV